MDHFVRRALDRARADTRAWSGAARDYVAGLGETQVLSAEESRELARGRRPEDREKLILGNYPLALEIAKAFRTRKIPDEDLVAAAMVGLCKAADRYDPDDAREANFGTVASQWIVRQLQITTIQDSTIRRPWVRCKIDADGKKVLQKPPVVLQFQEFHDGTILDPPAPEVPPAHDAHDQVQALCRCLHDRERAIVAARRGLLLAGTEVLVPELQERGLAATQDLVARRLRVSRARVQRIESLAMQRLREWAAGAAAREEQNFEQGERRA